MAFAQIVEAFSQGDQIAEVGRVTRPLETHSFEEEFLTEAAEKFAVRNDSRKLFRGGHASVVSETCAIVKKIAISGIYVISSGLTAVLRPPIGMRRLTFCGATRKLTERKLGVSLTVFFLQDANKGACSRLAS
jgi:hypothetical protein